MSAPATSASKIAAWPEWVHDRAYGIADRFFAVYPRPKREKVLSTDFTDFTDFRKDLAKSKTFRLPGCP